MNQPLGKQAEKILKNEQRQTKKESVASIAPPRGIVRMTALRFAAEYGVLHSSIFFFTMAFLFGFVYPTAHATTFPKAPSPQSREARATLSPAHKGGAEKGCS
ncbi:hypothetical protein HUU05_04215 [candidate division KSB1 bacterium]|nr:hypothetical protein [candidate division KSB1 bacterium]